MGAGRPAAAQPEPIGGNAANLVLLAAADVTLKTQTVEFSFLAEPRAWAVTARYELSSSSDRAQTVQLAVPEYACDPDGELDAGCDPSRPGFSQLTATLREHSLRLRKSRPPSAAERRDGASAPAQLWDFALPLAPRETLPIDLRYAVPAGSSNDGGWTASFRLRGGVAWPKPIGRATFKFVLPAYSCSVVEPDKLQRKSRRVVQRDGALWLELVFEAYVWNPPPGLALFFEPCQIARDSELADCPAASALQRYFYAAEPDEQVDPISERQLRAELERLDRGQLDRCQRAVFEAYASHFEPAELKRLPEHPESGRHYTAPLLTAADWSWVHYLDQRVKERPALLPAAAPQPEAAEPRGCACQLSRPSRANIGAFALISMIYFTRRLRRRS
jgi:hypothetical protein